MNLLFIHQNMPAQFRHLAMDYAAHGHKVVFITKANRNLLPNVSKVEYSPGTKPSESIHPWLLDIETKVINGQTVAHAIQKLKFEQGFVPDLVVGHTGWGEMMFVKDVLPNVPVVGYFELYLRDKGYYGGFDPEFPSNPDYGAQIRVINLTNHAGMVDLDGAMTPTQWQKASYPELYQPKIQVLHEGVDTELVRPRPNATLTLADGRVLSRADEVVTYVARNLEPVRGFHIFARAVEKLLQRRPDTQVVIIGGNGRSYGPELAGGKSYRDLITQNLALDPARVHFLGHVPYETYRDALHISKAHVYLTYPFILSWSLIEAMAAGCVIIASRTGPLLEVIEDGRTGVLTDFFDVDGLVDRVDHALKLSFLYDGMRGAARRFALENYDMRRVCLPRAKAYLETFVN